MFQPDTPLVSLQGTRTASRRRHQRQTFGINQPDSPFDILVGQAVRPGIATNQNVNLQLRKFGYIDETLLDVQWKL
jgi:hypothetical protein